MAILPAFMPATALQAAGNIQAHYPGNEDPVLFFGDGMQAADELFGRKAAAQDQAMGCQAGRQRVSENTG